MHRLPNGKTHRVSIVERAGKKRGVSIWGLHPHAQHSMPGTCYRASSLQPGSRLCDAYFTDKKVRLREVKELAYTHKSPERESLDPHQHPRPVAPRLSSNMKNQRGTRRHGPLENRGTWFHTRVAGEALKQLVWSQAAGCTPLRGETLTSRWMPETFCCSSVSAGHWSHVCGS